MADNRITNNSPNPHAPPPRNHPRRRADRAGLGEIIQGPAERSALDQRQNLRFGFEDTGPSSILHSQSSSRADSFWCLDVGSESSFCVGHAEAEIDHRTSIAFLDRRLVDV